MSQLLIGNKNTVFIPACQVQPGNVLVSRNGVPVKVTAVLDLEEQVIIYTDALALNVKKDLLTRIQKLA